MAQIPETFDVGLVFGKFYPLTKGHQYLIETARKRCRRLYVAISGLPTETIPHAIRAAWIRQLYPGVTVVEQPQDLPYFPEDCPSLDEFYGIWTKELQKVCGGRSPDVIFTSEDYGATMAQYLQCANVLVDKRRQMVPVSGTKVRADPFGCWDFLDPIVRSYFVKVVCVYGPESTGKTTLCEKLAKHYETNWQPEWAREYLGDRHCTYNDMEIIARGHFGEHRRCRDQANKVLFMDTDAITTKIFSEQYYQCCPKFVRDMADQMGQYVALYLVTDIDVPWVADSSRDLGEPQQRAMMKDKHLAELKSRGLPYVMITGNWEQRLAKAIDAVDRFIFVSQRLP